MIEEELERKIYKLVHLFLDKSVSDLIFDLICFYQIKCANHIISNELVNIHNKFWKISELDQ